MKKKRFLAALLAAAMTMTSLPSGATFVYAEEAGVSVLSEAGAEDGLLEDDLIEDLNPEIVNAPAGKITLSAENAGGSTGEQDLLGAGESTGGLELLSEGESTEAMDLSGEGESTVMSG